MLDQATRRWRAALFVFMLVAGVGMASWVARTPAVRDALGVSTGGMGVVLFGLSTGSMAGVLVSGPLVRRYGGRAVMWGGAAVLTAGLAVTAGGAAWSLAGGVFAGLALFGSGLGLAEVAVNIEGAAVERRIGRPVLPVLHGCFSLGTVFGALLGLVLTAARFPVGAHLLAVAVLTAAATVWAVRSVPAGTGREAAPEAAAGPKDRLAALRVWRDGRLVLIGVIVLVMAFTEGAANDWLPLLMVDGHGVSATAGSLTYTAFAVAMTVGRFAGGPFLERFGRAAVVRASAAVAAVGVALVVFSPSPLVAGAAVVLWGLGASLGFPVSISAAGDDPEGAAARVSAVATAGYLAFLVGPPSLGFLADHVGLRPTMGVVLGLLVVAALLAPALRPRGPRVAATAVPPQPDGTTAVPPRAGCRSSDSGGRP